MFDTSAVIAAPPERVADLLLTARPGPVGPENGWLVTHARYAHRATLKGGPDRFDVDSGNGYTLTLDVDRARKTAALQGGWWHRGEYAITPEPGGGTRLRYRVFNVALQPIRVWEDEKPRNSGYVVPTNHPEVLSLEEAAALLRVKPNDIKEMAEAGELPGRKVGSQWRFSHTALMNWLQAQ